MRSRDESVIPQDSFLHFLCIQQLCTFTKATQYQKYFNKKIWDRLITQTIILVYSVPNLSIDHYSIYIIRYRISPCLRVAVSQYRPML